MHTHNEIRIRAPLKDCLRVAADVERWPDILPHYRSVRFLRKDEFGRGRVRMSAFRHFGPLPYPTWWVSEMVTDREAGTIRYRHVDGITSGMDVLWELTEEGAGTRIVVLHDWSGPRWPLIGGLAARRVIGPHFIRVVADRTLEGVKRAVEARIRADAAPPAAAETGSRPPTATGEPHV